MLSEEHTFNSEVRTALFSSGLPQVVACLSVLTLANAALGRCW